MAYTRKNKTYKIISNYYYQPRIVININRYVQNCDSYRRSIILRDKTLELLKLLLILERPQQYISIDFYELPIDRNGYDIVIIKNQKIERPSRKLDYQILGPYKVLKKIGNLHKVKLPDSIKVYPVFLLDKLRKAANDLLPGHKNKPPLLI